MPQDILLDENFDLQIANGDLVVGESTYQHQKILIFADKGQFKANPTIGVGSRRYLETSKPDELAREIRLEFYGDGMDVKTLSIADNLEIKIDAEYKI